jgi:hypothetical protein
MVGPYRPKVRQRKANTNKIVDRLTYSPLKHKQKFTKKLRSSLQAKAPTVITPTSSPHYIKFGSININGLDLEANWAVEQLISKNKFDVNSSNICKIK